MESNHYLTNVACWVDKIFPVIPDVGEGKVSVGVSPSVVQPPQATDKGGAVWRITRSVQGPHTGDLLKDCHCSDRKTSSSAPREVTKSRKKLCHQSRHGANPLLHSWQLGPGMSAAGSNQATPKGHKPRSPTVPLLGADLAATPVLCRWVHSKGPSVRAA